MKMTVKVILEEEGIETLDENIFSIEKKIEQGYEAGLTLEDSKNILRELQQRLVLHQAAAHIASERKCPSCNNKRLLKGQHTIRYKTLFGVIFIPSVRLHYCPCEGQKEKTFSPLRMWLPEHFSPELAYMESKWGSYMSFNKTADLLQDVLPIHASHNGATVKNHLHRVAERQENDLKGKPFCISGCINIWSNLPRPDKPLMVGIDGGYVRSCKDRKKNFEVIVGKSFSQTRSSKRFGWVHALDDRPQRRFLSALREQGLQENQQLTFLTDGADNIRELQLIMHPESEHVLDWFHLTMRLTVLSQFTKGLSHSDPEAGGLLESEVKNLKWYLWHGNVPKAEESLEEGYLIVDDERITYKNRQKLLRHLEELMSYVKNNSYMIPNYGERWRHGEAIASSFVESTVNEVVSKRMAKKQQMQWSDVGAHRLLQVRTAVLNDDLREHFKRWYPPAAANTNSCQDKMDIQKNDKRAA